MNLSGSIADLADLVKRIPAAGEPPLTLRECRCAVQEAHDYLVERSIEALRRAGEVGGLRYWGSAIKRIRVRLPREERPRLVSPGAEEHNLVEVVNQCATMERLIDALEWAAGAGSGLSEYQVERCHPTTSSSFKDDEDHDLVLIGQDKPSAKFEVSDVSGAGDGNQKEKKDLISLGVLSEGTGQQMFPKNWPTGRLFLVVSEEFSERLRTPSRAWLKGKPPHCRYKERLNRGKTWVFEVEQGGP